MITVEVKDGQTGDQRLKINGEGAAHVVSHTHPPLDENIITLPFRQYFRNSAGSNDLRVNGSTTEQEFCITASETRDIYIKTVSVIISDAGASLNQFGSITALTNGVEFFWSSQSAGKIVIHEGLKTNFQFVRLALGSPAFGTAASSFRANNISGNSEGFIPVLDMSQTFGMPWGIVLRKGTNDRLAFNVRDNLTAIDAFDIIGYGIQI